MFSESSKTKRKRIWAALVLATVCAVALPASGDKKKKPPAAPEQQMPKRVNFDISKIVWPSPPEIARVRFLQQFTGEKIDFSLFNKEAKKKPKQGGDQAASRSERQAALPADPHLRAGLRLQGQGLCRRPGRSGDLHFRPGKEG
jgi:hypothetical protein